MNLLNLNCGNLLYVNKKHKKIKTLLFAWLPNRKKVRLRELSSMSALLFSDSDF